jgi:hypothetical protein
MLAKDLVFLVERLALPVLVDALLALPFPLVQLLLGVAKAPLEATIIMVIET